MEYRTIEYEVDGGVATIAINRPERRNALTRAALEEIGAAVAAASADAGVRGILVTGRGPHAFAAGADIGELEALASTEAVELSRAGQRVLGAIEGSRKPVVAAVNGAAMGGGCELALACHLRVAARSAIFGLPEVRLGTLPGYGGTARLARVVGTGRALHLILTGDPIDAEEAHRIGLVNVVAEDGAVLEVARGLLERILANAPLAVGAAIQAVVSGAGASLEEALALESALFGVLASTEDMREGVRAFLEKRPPRFLGR